MVYDDLIRRDHDNIDRGARVSAVFVEMAVVAERNSKKSGDRDGPGHPLSRLERSPLLPALFLSS